MPRSVKPYWYFEFRHNVGDVFKLFGYGKRGGIMQVTKEETKEDLLIGFGPTNIVSI